MKMDFYWSVEGEVEGKYMETTMNIVGDNK